MGGGRGKASQAYPHPESRAEGEVLSAVPLLCGEMKEGRRSRTGAVEGKGVDNADFFRGHG